MVLDADLVLDCGLIPFRDAYPERFIECGIAEQDMVCQTENISASGMLLRTEKRYEKGTRLEFEFGLPNDHRPIVGIAEIVRHTMIGRDNVSGVGVRFLSFAGDSQRRFESYIDSL